MRCLKGLFTQFCHFTHLLLTTLQLETLLTFSNLHSCSVVSQTEKIPPRGSLSLVLLLFFFSTLASVATVGVNWWNFPSVKLHDGLDIHGLENVIRAVHQQSGEW